MKGITLKLFYSLAIFAGSVSSLVFAQDASNPIITFSQSHNLVQGPDENMVEVFPDGAVIINRSPGNRNPGIFKRQLTGAELSEIVSLAESAGVAVINPATLSSASSDTGEVFYISDPTTTVMEFSRAANGNALVDSQSEASIIQTVEIENLSSVSSDARGANPLKELQIKLINIFTEAGL